MPFVNLFLDDELHAALKEMAKHEGLPLYKLIPQLLEADSRKIFIDIGTSEILPVPTKKSSLGLLIEERGDIDFGLNFKPVPKPANGRKRAKTAKKPADMSDNVE